MPLLLHYRMNSALQVGEVIHKHRLSFTDSYRSSIIYTSV